MIKEDNDTFIRITNKDVYQKICDMENNFNLKFKELEKNFTDKFEGLSSNQKITNGKVKLNKWMATTSLSLIFLIIAAIIKMVFS